jgi:hypothetical protein
MLSLDDCIELSKLSEEEILAIAEHEHIPEMAALELGAYLVVRPDGQSCIKAMIRDDIAEADRRGERDRSLALRLLLRNFVAQHPCCDERTRAEQHTTERRNA